MNKSFLSVRGKKHAKHPQIVVKTSRTRFGSVTLTHSKGKRKSKNIPLPDNPNEKDLEKSYFSKRIVEDFKFNFTKMYKNYTLSNEDIDVLIKFLEEKKK